MLPPRKRSKLISWIATLAILMSALAPTISHALSLSKASKGFVAEICTTSGIKLAQAIDEDSSPSPSAAEGHCPYCVVSPLYLLPNATAIEFHAPGCYTKQSLFSYESPRLLFSWLSLPSRSPPIHS
jgi:Protein of unknown function (DUF2946)